jgi:dephospho-CoA kinase
MRGIVFDDVQARRRLEAIVHPRVRMRLRAQCEAASSLYAVADIPLLTEGGGRTAYPWLDRILLVDVPETVQAERVMARDRVDAELARRMIAAQATRAQRLAIADDIMVNDGPLETLDGHVIALHRRYLVFAGL